MSTGNLPSMLGMTVRSSPAPVMARICDCFEQHGVDVDRGTGVVVDARRGAHRAPGDGVRAGRDEHHGHPQPGPTTPEPATVSRSRAWSRVTRRDRSNTVGRVSVFAAATGIGSWPGTAAREAAEVVVGELHQLTHLVELPARGVGADMIGRAGALLVDIGIDTVPRGYRIAPGRSARAPARREPARRGRRRARGGLGAGGFARQRAQRSRCRRPAPSRWPRTSNSPTGIARSPTAVRCATWRTASPRASPPTGPSWRGGWKPKWWSSSTSRRCPPHWRAG